MSKAQLHSENPELLLYTEGRLHITVLGGVRLSGLDRLKVTLKLTIKEKPNGAAFRHHLDLYNSIQCEQLIEKAPEVLDLSSIELSTMIKHLITSLENYRGERLEDMKPKQVEKRKLTEAERKTALAFLKSPNLLERTRQAIAASGLIGEETNSMIAYLTYTSRKRYTPLHLMCLGASGTGKTWLQERVSELIPEEDKLEITSLSTNAFYYFGREELKHKLLLIEDLDGGLLATTAYTYDANGNVTKDGRNGVTIVYNQLNLPQKVTKTGLDLSYVYDAAGSKLRKLSTIGTTDYVDGVQYKDGTIEFIQTAEGIARNSQGIYSYEYNLQDHLGNVRYSFNRNPASGVLEKMQEDNYYPFGLRKVAKEGGNKYLYNGKELQEELGQYDYGARFYDPVIGRFNTVDPLSAEFDHVTPYNYALNNPILMIDPDGMAADTTKANLPKAEPLPSSPTPSAAGSVAAGAILLNEVVIEGASLSRANAFATAAAASWIAGWGIGDWLNRPNNNLAFTTAVASFLVKLGVDGKYLGLKPSIVNSKGGKRNIWPDEYGYPPNVKDIKWKDADSKLADDLSNSFGDKKRGQGTPNNLARKWFRDKRPKK